MMADPLFFQNVHGFEKHHEALQRWNNERRPLNWNYLDKSYVILFRKKGDHLHITCNQTKYIYHKDGGHVTLTTPGNPSTSWEEIMTQGKGKTIRFHIPDETPYIREAILFVALSALTAYGALKVKNKYFPKKPPPPRTPKYS